LDAKEERPRKQYGAVPFRVRDDGTIQVMLITSRETRRWIVPKGWPKKGGPRPTAKAEAFEESGVRGKVHRKPLGSFEYRKKLNRGRHILCKLQVFPLSVKKQAKNWPERLDRTTRWFSLTDAAKLCSDPELGVLLRKLKGRIA
jgi:8-oxo-dGTP pyrophosphatase MutT (NUDIX family)